MKCTNSNIESISKQIMKVLSTFLLNEYLLNVVLFVSDMAASLNFSL
jgi:hypothetical protein